MAEVAVSQGGWNPTQYDRFKDERRQPFFDLAALVLPSESGSPGPRVADLGCGSGELTAWLHQELGAAETVGVDSSEAMLAQSEAHVRPGVRFERMDILEATEAYAGQFDVVFSNAALQWITGHESLIPRVARLAKPGGQLAVQMPANGGHVSHRTAAAVAQEEPYRGALGGWLREDPVQAPDWYASLLHREVGAAEQRVYLEVYGHLLPDTRAMVEWVKGSLLTAYLARLPEGLRQPFVERYTERLLEAAGEQAPFFYPFPRVFLWARLPS
ncbi:MAG: methyltransferase domain-containing protein [Dehalococcoidia bacterium]|nr:methyltransferase domain-containing protein [Dehalococcoidia bacterium]